VTGFFVLGWQLSVQNANTLAANATKDRNALHLDIYREIATSTQESSRSLSRLVELLTQADTAIAFADYGIAKWPTREQLQEASAKITESVIALMTTMDKWAIAVGPKSADFHDALSDDLGSVGSNLSTLLSLMPPPTVQAEPDKLTTTIGALRWAAFGIEGHLRDLRGQAQNLLLGGLFTHRIPPRRPTDPSVRVVSLDDLA